MAHGKARGRITAIITVCRGAGPQDVVVQLPSPCCFKRRFSRKRRLAPPSFFPVRSVWTLALNSALTVPPAYDAGPRLLQHRRRPARRLRPRYRASSCGSSWPRALSQPAAGDGLVFLAEPEAITAVRQTDGGVAWRFPFRRAPRRAARVGQRMADRRRTCPARSWLFARPTVASIWRHDIGAEVHAQPALAADRVYVPSADGRARRSQGRYRARRCGNIGSAGPSMTSSRSRTACLWAATTTSSIQSTRKAASILWRWRTGGDIVGRAAFDDKHVYFVVARQSAAGLDRKSGAQLWKRSLSTRPTSGPLLAGTTILVSGREAALRAFASKDGAPGTDVKTDGTVASPPAIVPVPGAPDPFLIYVTTDLARGATVTASTRSIDPPVSPTIAPLPNPTKP